jgi:hypothetical protein
VYHDLLGMMQHPHHAKVTPKFCKQYAAVGQVGSVARDSCSCGECLPVLQEAVGKLDSGLWVAG